MTTSTGHGTASTHAAQRRTARVTVLGWPWVARPRMTRPGVARSGVARSGVIRAGMAGASPGRRR
jgi:hypothetical protein